VIADRLDEARHYAERALAFARERQMRGCEALALRLLAETALRNAPFDATKAVDPYRQARALAEELRMRPLVAHCELGLAKLNQRIGQRPEAREHITTAVTMYRAMDMPFWLRDAEATMRELA
jgi:hypothetical protein